MPYSSRVMQRTSAAVASSASRSGTIGHDLVMDRQHHTAAPIWVWSQASSASTSSSRAVPWMQ
jgi:hypothetical protein